MVDKAVKPKASVQDEVVLAASSHDAWLTSLAGPGALGGLLAESPQEQVRLGYAHTLREIAQQPVTWLGTAERLIAHLPGVAQSLEGVSVGRAHGLGQLDLRRRVRRSGPAASRSASPSRRCRRA